jgi:hypothetical protein
MIGCRGIMSLGLGKPVKDGSQIPTVQNLTIPNIPFPSAIILCNQYFYQVKQYTSGKKS